MRSYVQFSCSYLSITNTMLSFIPSPVLLRASLAPRPLRLAPIPLPHNEIGAAWSDLPSVLAAAAASQPLPFLSKGAWANTEAEFWEPIYLSTMAGLSTCIGASVAFVVDATKPEGDDGDAAATSSRAVGVGPDLLAFSLALAGSVMVTVCVVSIIPEALSLDFDGADGETTWSALGQDPSQLILQRGAGFAAGWGVYALLSRMLSALPEQDEWGSYLVGDGASTSFDADDDTRTQTSTQSTTKQASWRLTILLFLSLLLHNFPEGLAVAFSAASSLPSSSSVVSTEIEPATSALSAIATGISSLGGGMSSVSSHPLVSSSIMIPAHETLAPAASTSSLASIVTLSIALHNIPEGLAIG